MKAAAFYFASLLLIGVARGQSDSTLASVQQTLKDQGFYYGEVTGKKDADTTAAVRRYQIRNGLQITGELNAETQKSLGIKGATYAPPRATPPPLPRAIATPAMSPKLRVDREPLQLSPGYSPSEMVPTASGIFDGTPYEKAPAESQRRVVASAQGVLARRGYYHDLIDGDFGPGTQFALRAFQSRFGMQPDGKLNTQTLGAMGLLPGQRVPGLTASPQRSGRRATSVAPNGEAIYEPR